MKLPKMESKFKPDPVKSRIAKNYRLSADAVAIIDELAAIYKTTAGKVIEEMMLSYGAKLVKKNKPSTPRGQSVED